MFPRDTAGVNNLRLEDFPDSYLIYFSGGARPSK